MYRLFILSILIFLYSFGQAQVVNIESSRIQTDTVGWAGSGGAAVSVTKNTQQVVTIDIEAHLQYKTEKSLWLILGDYGFLKGGSEKFLLNSFGHLRFNHKLNKWIRWEAFTQVQSNHIMQIRSRYLTGTGPRFKLVSKPKFRLYAASLAMFEHETEKTKPAIVHNNIRSSSYISFTVLPTENIELVSTTFYQPLYNNFQDARIFNQTSFTISATERFSMYLKWNWIYDKKPAGTAPKTNYQMVSGFKIEF
ncbi:MAG: DUF481 domain-containing protein [Chitinophagaceae bacterium]|nr:DUF481 domain-containing protein [Chitinophagaceae bacterium]